MKLNAFRAKEDRFSGILWKVIITRDPEGGPIQNFVEDRTLSFICVTGTFGKVDAYFDDSEADLASLDQLSKLTGPDGKELFTNGVWQIEQIAPNINMWGRREGFKARLAVIGTDNS